MNMDCRTGRCGHTHNHADHSEVDLPEDFRAAQSFNLTPDPTGVCRFETDPEAIAAIRHGAQRLRDAKKAHTEWEARFEGPVPAHDWEVWYAQYMLAQAVRQGGNPTVPCSITKLMTLVGPLE